MKKYSDIFFDLDHTLWDFDRNSAEAIRELAETLNLYSKGVSGHDDFMTHYRRINHEMWDAYHRHAITKEELRTGRFRKTLELFGIHDLQLAEKMATGYVEISPHKTNLFPGAVETLEYLKERYRLHIITNGFREVQHIKIQKSGLTRFFDHIHISEEVGYKKPEPEIFFHAMKKAKSASAQCIMIGDNLDTDIRGAINAGLDCVWFNPDGIEVEHSRVPVIRNLYEVTRLL
jgi:putative hydrolase of the HAD superfamily